MEPDDLINVQTIMFEKFILYYDYIQAFNVLKSLAKVLKKKEIILKLNELEKGKFKDVHEPMPFTMIMSKVTPFNPNPYAYYRRSNTRIYFGHTRRKAGDCYIAYMRHQSSLIEICTMIMQSPEIKKAEPIIEGLQKTLTLRREQNAQI